MTLPTVTTLTTLLDKNDFTLVSNCSVYNRLTNAVTTWRCSSCNAGYYLSHNATTLSNT